MTPADLAIQECLSERRSFLVDAGAGSGKTSSLIRAIRYIAEGTIGPALGRDAQKVACITYTKVARDEIIERTDHNPLVRVSTIHDFVWSVIKPYQQSLKEALVSFNDQLHKKVKGEPDRRRREPQALRAALDLVKITYSDQGSEFLEGRIFHNELLDLARLMFKTKPLLSRIVAAQYPIIFVDEYQDTNAAVVEILIDFVLATQKGRFTVGFFGDKFQRIYGTGVGEMEASRLRQLRHITKSENYRCSKAVISVLNGIRSDIRQVPSGNNVAGSAKYVHLSGNLTSDPVGHAKDALECLGWASLEGSEKVLFLTHRLMARRAGYEGLLEAYEDRGAFHFDHFKDGDDICLNYFRERIEPLAAAWHDRKTALVLTMLRANGFTLSSNRDKATAAGNLDKLLSLRQSGTVEDLLKHLVSTRLMTVLDELRQVVAPGVASGASPVLSPEDIDFFARFKNTPYAEVAAYCDAQREHSAFSTKHGVKGAEFDTVFVVLDDRGSKWTHYSFDKYLSGDDQDSGKQDRHIRSRNLFYVCCSRARVNLAVIDLGDRSPAKERQLANLFGAENCHFLGGSRGA